MKFKLKVLCFMFMLYGVMYVTNSHPQALAATPRIVVVNSGVKKHASNKEYIFKSDDALVGSIFEDRVRYKQEALRKKHPESYMKLPPTKEEMYAKSGR